MKNIDEKVQRFALSGNRGRTLFKLLLFLIIFGGVLSAAWIYFLPTILTSALQKRTGFGVKVTELWLNPFNAKVDLKGLIITNPAGFPRQDFIDVSSFNANAKLATLFSDKPEFDYAYIEVACVTFVRDADGVVNARLFNDRMNQVPPGDEQIEGAKKAKAKETKPDAMVSTGGPVNLSKAAKKNDENKDAKDPKAAKGQEAVAAKDKNEKDTAADQPSEKPMRFLIRRLEVRLEKVVVADYTGASPSVREFDRKFIYTYNDVSDPKQLLAPFALKSLEPVGAAIKGLIPGDMGKAFGAATKPVDNEILKKPATPADDPLKTVVEKLEESQKP
jgi:hypothetical protein